MAQDSKLADGNALPLSSLERGDSIREEDTLAVLGYKAELTRNRSLFTLLFQSLAIAAIPFGEGGPLISAIVRLARAQWSCRG
jgi:hypothetical protein